MFFDWFVMDKMRMRWYTDCNQNIEELYDEKNVVLYYFRIFIFIFIFRL